VLNCDAFVHYSVLCIAATGLLCSALCITVPLNPFTVFPKLTRHALTLVQRNPRVNSSTPYASIRSPGIPNKLVLMAISNYNDFIIVIKAFHTVNYAKWVGQ